MTETLLHRHYQNKRVWISGHTGFKGAWLVQWLIELGAKVHGFSHPPVRTTPNLFEQLDVGKAIHSETGDVNDPSAVQRSLEAAAPDYVFHLAAQPLVRSSYDNPVATYRTNLMGTINVLEALRSLKKPCAAVFVTTDKCYENREWHYGYRESDALGGHDPYSSSKAAAELAIHSWRRSFFQEHAVRIASARSGNAIGGGDWAMDRAVPGCIHAAQNREIFKVSDQKATRPWLHVLDSLSGYLWLGAVLRDPSLRPCPPELVCSAFNFGPGLEGNRTLRQLVEEIHKHFPGEWREEKKPNAPHEACLLNLAIDKTQHLLGWAPVWNFERSVAATIQWYRSVLEDKGTDCTALTLRQIREYQADAAQNRAVWAKG